MEKLLSLLNNNLDKVAHFSTGYIIATAVPHGLPIAIFAAITKEIYDYLNLSKHTCDVWDAVATISGGIIGHFVIGG